MKFYGLILDAYVLDTVQRETKKRHSLQILIKVKICYFMLILNLFHNFHYSSSLSLQDIVLLKQSSFSSDNLKLIQMISLSFYLNKYSFILQLNSGEQLLDFSNVSVIVLKSSLGFVSSHLYCSWDSLCQSSAWTGQWESEHCH